MNAETRPLRDDSGTIETRSVFRGRVLDVNVEHVRYPDGSEGQLEIVRHRGAAAALPVYRQSASSNATARWRKAY